VGEDDVELVQRGFFLPPAFRVSMLIVRFSCHMYEIDYFFTLTEHGR